MSTGREVKDRLYVQFAQLGHALSSPKRLELLDLLCQSEKTVETLAEHSSMSVANTSRHLQVLRGARLVDRRQDGVFVYYRLAGSEVCGFFRDLRRLAESRMAEIDRIMAEYFDPSMRLQPVDRKTLLKRARVGEVVILDVRPEDEFSAGHLPWAVSVPLSQLRKRLKELSPDKEIVAYCRGPYCVLAQEAVSLLRSKGFSAFRLSDGIAEWRDVGLPVEPMSVTRR
ncbi:MAG: metalloregulator ArsR/SmtB family transcription factor [Candidatus Zixiibacteriota bacterium]